ncbi:MAG: MarR family transcriptional regulator [Propionibacteriales bacterium]|nr:MarR family transcriptional regulator [Propionibacteriales bacterium]
MTQPGIDVTRSVGLALKRAVTSLRTAMDDVLRPLGLTVSQYACLEQLAQRPGLSAAALARLTFVTRQSAHTLLQGLEERGLLERSADPPSGRALPLQLTSTGAALLRSASTAVAAVETHMVSAIDANRVDQLLVDLDAFASALDQEAGPASGAQDELPQ